MRGATRNERRHKDVQRLDKRPARDAMRKEDVHLQPNLKDQVPEPAKAESPPETAHSSYRASLRGVSGVLDALWSSASSPPKGKPVEDNGNLAQSASLSSAGSSEPEANLGEDEEYIKITRRLQELDGATPSSDKMQTPDSKIPGTTQPGSQNWLNKSVSKVLGWRHTAEELETPRGQEIIQHVSDQLSSRATAIVQLLPQIPEQATAEDLEDILLWKVPLQSAKVAGIGGYFLVCLRHLLNGVDLVQPSTVLASLSICSIIWFSLASSKYGNSTQAVIQIRSKQVSRDRMEQRVQAALNKLTPLITALWCILTKHLCGGARTGGKVWLGLALWLVIIVGESGLLSQATLMIWVWAALFTLPSVYLASKPVLDDLVEECITFGRAAIQSERRKVTGASCLVALFVFGLLEARIFLRLTIALCTCVLTLLWHEKYMRSKNSRLNAH